MTAVCAALLGAALFAGGNALADERCPQGHAAAGLCAPLHFVDDDFSRSSDLLRRQAYERGYHDALRGRKEVAPPPDIALDGKEGYSQGYQVHRQYLDRDGYDRDRYDRRSDRDRYGRRYYDRDEYYERRLRRDDAGEVVDFATQILRGLSN